jgi:hypothetical protein
MRLLKVHKNLLFENIVAQHLNPLDFEYKEERFDIKVQVPRQKFFFNFATDRFSIFPYKNLYSSYDYLVSDSNMDDYVKRLLYYFTDWLRLISTELRTEDKWAAFIQSSKNVPITDSEKFNGELLSYKEVQEFSGRVIESRKYFERLDIPFKLLHSLYQNLIYISNKSKTIESKHDWANLSKGVLITELVKLNKSLPHYQFEQLMAIIRNLFEKYFKFQL